MSDAVISPAPKLDPETLAIRTRPSRTIRFRRGVIIAIAALGSVSLIAVAWIALKPRVFTAVADRQELSEPGNRPSADALNGLPSTYGDVPKLGPPLPGDLGRPILESERRMATETGTGSDPSATQERDRRLAELKAARESGVLVQDRTIMATPAVSEAVAAPASAAIDAAKPPVDPDRDPNGQGRKAQFVAALDPSDDVNPHTLIGAPSPFLLSAGSVISAALITGLRSDLPGLVTAQVTAQVFDSPTGRILLIPQGSRLVGSYDSVVAFGQKRALVVWQRIILPDGSSVRIDNVPATDTAGYAGLSDKVDVHTWQLLKGVVLSTLLGAGTDLSFGNGESDLVRAIRESAQQSGSRAGSQIVTKNLNVQPTIQVRPGWPLRVVVHKDIVLRPWRMAGR